MFCIIPLENIDGKVCRENHAESLPIVRNPLHPSRKTIFRYVLWQVYLQKVILIRISIKPLYAHQTKNTMTGL